MNRYNEFINSEYNLIKIDEDLINKDNMIGKGTYASVYKLNANECVKIWDCNIKRNHINKINYFSKFSFNCATFPKRLVLLRNKVCGYTMNLIVGKSLEFCEDFDFSVLIAKYKDYIDSIEDEISLENISISDVHEKNIMFNNLTSSFTAIDIDMWYLHNGDKYQTVNNNYRSSVFAFARWIFNNSFEDPFFKCAYKLQKDSDFIDFYESIRYDLERYNRVKIKTVSEFKECLKR